MHAQCPFPKTDGLGKKITLKGKTSVHDTTRVMPEKLDDGFGIAAVFREFLCISPSTGNLFQTTTPKGEWSAKPWKTETISRELRRAL